MFVDATLAAVGPRDKAGTRQSLRQTGTATALFHRDDGRVDVRDVALGL